MKSFAELASLQRELRQRERDERQRRQQARLTARRERQDHRLFAQALAGVEPLKPDGRHRPAPVALPPIPVQHHRDEAAALAESLSDDIDIDRLLETDETLSYRQAGIGADVVRRLRRGEWVVKRQIDLHGLRVDQARAALAEFLGQALRAEHRCVRVIHGKGLGSPNRQPVLKGKVLKWLIQRSEVLAFCQARPNDGGSGVLIVLLQLQGADERR